MRRIRQSDFKTLQIPSDGEKLGISVAHGMLRSFTYTCLSDAVNLFRIEGHTEAPTQRDSEFVSKQGVMKQLTATFQVTDVADTRLQQATAALTTKKGMMDMIDSGTRFLKLFVGIGSSVAEVCHYLR